MDGVPNGSGGARNTTAYLNLPPTPGAETIAAAQQAARPSPEIQGTTDVSPWKSDYTSRAWLHHRHHLANGFYFRDVVGDGNTATSDGLFVYRGGSWTNSEGWKPAIS